MNNEFKDFVDALSDNLESFEGEYEPFIDHGPQLFKILTDLLNVDDISLDHRLIISAAIAYYVVPMDVIPEQEYGPYGYIDDIYITSYVIKKISETYGFELLEELWESDSEENLEDIINECYQKSSEVLEDKKIEVLNFVGLK